MAKKKASTKKKPASKRSVRISQDDKWQAEDDVRTLMRAEEIQSDRKRMTKAKQVAKQQAAETAKVAAKLNRGKQK